MSERKWEKWTFALVTACAHDSAGRALYQELDKYYQQIMWRDPDGTYFDEVGCEQPGSIFLDLDGGAPKKKLGEFVTPQFVKET